MSNNINNKTSGWSTKSGRNGVNLQTAMKQGSPNPSMQDKTVNNASDKAVTKPTAHDPSMKKDGGLDKYGIQNRK
jgi:hypothetical protein